MTQDSAEAAADAADLAAQLARITPEDLHVSARPDLEAALGAARVASARLAARLCADERAPLLRGEQFARLLELAGPEDTPELLARLTEDLASVEAGLSAGLGVAPDTGVEAPGFGGGLAVVAPVPSPPPATQVIRSESHVLIALAGAVGAETLHSLARALNSAAHQAESGVGAAREAGAATIAALAGPVLAQLGRLRRLVAAEQAALGVSAVEAASEAVSEGRAGQGRVTA